MLETTGFELILLFLIMVAVAITSRWAGVYVMSFIPIAPSVESFIKAMSGSVLIALIAPLFLTGDTGAKLALATTLVFMIATRKALLAITMGMFVAALVRGIL